jgi:uncharacterized Tic20 family protein
LLDEYENLDWLLIRSFMNPTTEERIIAVISHLSALAMGMGLIVPAIFWSENRNKSAYLRFQTLQALGYQSLGYTVWLLSILLLVVLLYIVLFFIALVVPNAGQSQTITMGISIILFVALFGLLGLYLVIPLVGAVSCGLGKDFRYPTLGARLARSLGYEISDPEASLDSAAEERFAASMGHFAVIIPLWGLLAPAYLWISQGKSSAYLKFQSAQTTIYQIIVNLLYFGLTFLSISLGVASMFLFASFMDFGEWTPVAGMMVMICLLGLVGLIIPLFHILGQWAGLRVLRGHDFRYPLLGGWVAKWFSK